MRLSLLLALLLATGANAQDRNCLAEAQALSNAVAQVKAGIDTTLVAKAISLAYGVPVEETAKMVTLAVTVNAKYPSLIAREHGERYLEVCKKTTGD